MQAPPGIDNARRKRVLEFIETNLANPITLADMADVAALSPYHFIRAFKKTMGTSPVRFLWLRRLELAKRLLRETNASVCSVAMACGFSSQSHMTNSIKEATGLCASDYRIKCRA